MKTDQNLAEAFAGESQANRKYLAYGEAAAKDGLPQVAKLAAQSGRYAGVIVLGTVIRGGTPHFDMIAAEVTKGVAQVALDTGLPMSFGVLTTDSVEQAIDRAGAKMGNKGWEAAMSVLEMADLARNLGAKKGRK